MGSMMGLDCEKKRIRLDVPDTTFRHWRWDQVVCSRRTSPTIAVAPIAQRPSAKLMIMKSILFISPAHCIWQSPNTNMHPIAAHTATVANNLATESFIGSSNSA